MSFQKLDLVVKVAGWDLAFRVEGRVSVLKFESQNHAFRVESQRTLCTWFKVCVGGCRAVAKRSYSIARELYSVSMRKQGLASDRGPLNPNVLSGLLCD